MHIFPFGENVASINLKIKQIMLQVHLVSFISRHLYSKFALNTSVSNHTKTNPPCPLWRKSIQSRCSQWLCLFINAGNDQVSVNTEYTRVCIQCSPLIYTGQCNCAVLYVLLCLTYGILAQFYITKQTILNV